MRLTSVSIPIPYVSMSEYRHAFIFALVHAVLHFCTEGLFADLFVRLVWLVPVLAISFVVSFGVVVVSRLAFTSPTYSYTPSTGSSDLFAYTLAQTILVVPRKARFNWCSTVTVQS